MQNLRFEQCRQSLTREDIASFEKLTGATLPQDFVNHYLKYNGGHPNANWSSGEEINYPFESFLSITYGENTIQDKLREFKSSGFDYGSRIVFACTDVRYFFCIDLSDLYYGQIFVRKPKFISKTQSYDLAKGEWEYHCAGFTDFIAGLNAINYYLFKYRNGQKAEVWNNLKEANNLSESFIPRQELDNVLKEMMKQVRINISILYHQLQNHGYEFSIENPQPPAEDIGEKIETLKNILKPYGHIPLTFEYFLQFVGSVNLIPLPGHKQSYAYTDPLYIAGIDEILELAAEREWEEEDEDEPIYLEISPDYYHKDNVSGGVPYGIEITPTPQIDSCLLNTPYGDIYFTDYLRLCFQWGGFPNIKEKNTDYQEFIDSLTENIKEI